MELRALYKRQEELEESLKRHIHNSITVMSPRDNNSNKYTIFHIKQELKTVKLKIKLKTSEIRKKSCK